MRGKLGFFSRPPLTPDMVSGLTGWYDASDSSTLYDATSGGSLVSADSTVARWEDKSGSGRHLTQSTSSERPTRKTNIKNGLDVLRFDGSNDNFGSSFNFEDLISLSASTVFLVGKATSNSSPDSFFAADTFISESVGYAFFFSIEGTIARVVASDSGTNTRFCTVSYSTGEWATLSARHNGATIAARSNRSDGGSATLVTRASGHGTLRIGCNVSKGRCVNGDIAEIVFYNTSLSDSDRDSVESYLVNKWAT
jgi:hypothetical protein